MWMQSTNKTHSVVTILCVENLYLEVNVYVTVIPPTKVTSDGGVERLRVTLFTLFIRHLIVGL